MLYIIEQTVWLVVMICIIGLPCFILYEYQQKGTIRKTNIVTMVYWPIFALIMFIANVSVFHFLWALPLIFLLSLWGESNLIFNVTLKRLFINTGIMCLLILILLIFFPQIIRLISGN